MKFDALQDDSDKYGTPGQQALTAAEGLGQGFAGPVATAAEAGLTKLGVPGLSPKEQALRATANPVTHYGTEAAGFGMGAATGTGEAALLSKIGEGAVAATGVAGRVASGAIRGGAELAALQAGDEISKTINSDPTQTIGTAAINIGLAGLLGAGGGAALSGLGKLADGARGKVDEFLNDYVTRHGAAEATSVSAQRAYDPFLKQYVDHEAQAATPTAVPLAKAQSAGEKYADWANQKGSELLSNATGRSAATTLGGIAGAIVGHPIAGAYAAERILGPTFSNLAKPFAENAVNSDAARAAVEYVANAVKGELVLNEAVKNIFRTTEVLSKNFMPSQESRDKLQKSLDQMSNPQNALNVGSGLAHYMPEHSTAAAATAGQAVTYLNSLKPRSVPSSPFDTAPPISKVQQAKYNRALDIAQQPLMVLKYTKDGTLTSGDVQTIQTLYPGLHSSIVSKIGDQLIDHHAQGNRVPYSQRLALARLTGSPLDSTMQQQNMMGIILAQRIPPSAPQPQQGSKPATAVALKQIDKTNSLYPTNLEQHQIQRRKP